MKKTIKEWFESEKDSELRKLLLENYDPEWCLELIQDEMADTMSEAICNGFPWGTSKEGVLFWSYVFKYYAKVELYDTLKEMYLESHKV
jgi:hypothetical protein